jgi:hypothetical protein
MQLQKSSGEHQASNKLGRALQKEEAVQVNGDLGRSEIRGESFGKRVVTKGCSVRRPRPVTVTRSAEAQGGVRTPSSGDVIAKSGAVVAGPGL